MVEDIRIVEKALGKVNYALTEKEKVSLVFRRSLFVVEDIEAGEAVTPQNVRSIRPGYGMHTRYLDQVYGRKALRKLSKGTPLSWELLG
jgi:sialic acid synthase SpsE